MPSKHEGPQHAGRPLLAVVPTIRLLTISQQPDTTTTTTAISKAIADRSAASKNVASLVGQGAKKALRRRAPLTLTTRPPTTPCRSDSLSFDNTWRGFGTGIQSRATIRCSNDSTNVGRPTAPPLGLLILSKQGMRLVNLLITSDGESRRSRRSSQWVGAVCMMDGRLGFNYLLIYLKDTIWHEVLFRPEVIISMLVAALIAVHLGVNWFAEDV
ncbi:hypothetical protein E2P81_ATG02237 [Venturia nashicola]|nr:hypothetical protein E2P81_ATG02237 [Venturia nashicola]